VVSRSLAGFLLFLLLLVVVGLLGTWYVGPSLVSLAFDEDRRDAPYYLLNFAAGEQDVEYQASYRAELAKLVVADGGQLLWQAVTIQVPEGRVRDEWQNVALFEFPRGGEVVEMLTSSSYRGLDDAHPAVSRMLLGTSMAPDALADGRATVLNLLTVGPEQDLADSVIRGLFGNLAAYDGSLIWEAELEDLEDRWPWNRALMLAFPTLERAESWLRDPGTVTQRALTATATRQSVILILRSGN
jgi:uncharacterized protein (DUF1330 family)